MSVDTIALAEELNRNCHCIYVDENKLGRALESSPITAGVYASILRDQPNLFSASPVFLARVHLDRMQAVIRAIESVVQSEPFRAWALALAPGIARVDRGPRGVFLGYDFLKLDVCNYVYDGQAQLVAARLYEGQATNFRTAAGGFAPVFTEAERWPPDQRS